MDSVLILVTVLALVVTIVMIGLVVKLLADERRRSGARVALLAGRAAEAGVSAGNSHREEDDDYELRHVSPLVTSGGLFSVEDRPSPWPGRLGIVAALALLVMGIGVAARATGVFDRSADSTSPSTPRGAVESTAAQANPNLLDLLSLTHSQRGDVLTITGLVQNPRDGGLLQNVAATAFFFGDDGTFLASGRAPLDFTVLRPGDETAFVINVTVAARVARYRVGFRGEDGRIIGHVDRRSPGTIARGPS